MRLAAVLLVVVLLGAGWVAFDLRRPYTGFRGETFIDFPKGTGTLRMAGMLAEAGVIRSRWQFLAARALNPHRTLQAGEYRFEGPAPVLAVFDRIARGDIFYYELVVPEGRNMFDIGEAAERLGLFPAAKFVEAARDPSAIRNLVPGARSLEGYLFPSVYKLSRRTTPRRLTLMMTAKFREAWRSLGTAADAQRTVTLASLIEKEGKLPEERPLIAAVFEHRLELGMKLDCDPTTIYAALLEGRWRGAIHRSDLDSGNPYNTYRHAGLPPGPIANPGLASIRAALAPAPGGALYFVLRPDGSGGHTFSRDIAGQQAAVVKYRRGVRSSK